MKSLFLFCSLFLSNYLFSQTEEWKYIGLDGKGNSTYYYKSNSKNTGWIKIESKETIYFDENQNEKKIDGYQLILWKFDCEEKQIGVIQSITYDKNSKVLSSINLKSYEIEMFYIVPNSVGELFFKSFCSE